MNIEIEDHIKVFIEEMCKEMNQSPSQLLLSLIPYAYLLYLNYEKDRKAGIEKRPFEQARQDLFEQWIKSRIRVLDVEDELVEITNKLIGMRIGSYMGTCVFDFNLDFDKRSISYALGYHFPSDSGQIHEYRTLLFEVEINPYYVQLSQLVFRPIVEGSQITENDLKDTTDFLQRYIEDKYVKKKLLSPFTNISAKVSTFGYHPINPRPDTGANIEISLTVKAEKAIHIPSVKKIVPIMEEILPIVEEKLLGG
jgi:hypothetical protein